MIKRNLFFLFCIEVVALASTVLCAFNYNPYTAAPYQFVFFYSSIFFTFMGIVALSIFYLKIGISKKETIYVHFWPSLRQAIFISAAFTALLILRGLRLLDMWVGIPLALIILLLELFFQTKKGKK